MCSLAKLEIETSPLNLISAVFTNDLQEAKAVVNWHSNGPDTSFFTASENCSEYEHPIEFRAKRIQGDREDSLEKYLLTLHDPACSFLKPCQYEFAEVVIYLSNGHEMFCDLSTFTATDMGGKKGLQCLRTALKTLNFAHCYLDDGSLILNHHCCDDAVPISLKLTQIFKKGKSWYELNGSHLTRHIDHMSDDALKEFVSENHFEAPILDYIPKYDTRVDLEAFVNKTLSTKNHNYLRASNYLHNLTIEQLKEMFSSNPNVFDISKLEAVQLAIHLTGCKEDARVGDLIERLHSLDQIENNKLLHRVTHHIMEKVVELDYSDLFKLLLNNIRDVNYPNRTFYALLTAFKLIKRVNSIISICMIDKSLSDDEAYIVSRDLMTSLWNIDDSSWDDRASKVFELSDKMSDQQIETWQGNLDELEKEYKPGYSNGIAYFHHSGPENFKKLTQIRFLGSEKIDFKGHLKTAIEELNKLTVQDLIDYDPHFMTRLKNLPDTNLTDTIESLAKHFSHNSDDLMTFYEDLLSASLESFHEQNLDFIYENGSDSDKFIFSKLIALIHTPLELDLS